MNVPSENERRFEFGDLVSVVIPTYNRAQTIVRAVESVLNQNYDNLEVIVVDDASDDDTTTALTAVADPRLRIVRHKRNLGCAAASNTGVRHARGMLIGFQDSDDEWLAGKLSKQVHALLDAGDRCVAAYCIKIVYGRDQARRWGRRLAACVPTPDEHLVSGDLSRRLQETNLVSKQTILCFRDAWREIGGFDETLRSSVDWDFVIRLAELGEFAFVDEPLVMTYVQGDSISRQSRKALYSQLTIANKMKRRGVSSRTLARHWSRIGHKMGKHGLPTRGHTLVRSALAVDPLNLRYLLRYGAVNLYRIRESWRARGRALAATAMSEKGYKTTAVKAIEDCAE